MTIERTREGDQIVLPGAERSARQAAAAREGPTGKLRARKPQRDPGGMFDLPPAEPELF